MKKLRRSRKNRVVCGVMGGIAEYFDIDSTVIRLLWILATLFFGSGIFCYIICALVMPIKKDEPLEYEYVRKDTSDTDI